MNEALEEDFTKLPLEEQLGHKAWKARVNGYKTLIEEFENSTDESDECFSIVTGNLEILKNFALDSNVISQEQGILAVAKFLQFGGTPARVEKLKQTPLVRSLCEKGLSSNRAGTKSNAAECMLQLVEVSGSGDWLFEVISSFYDNRLPKLVAGCVNCTMQIVENFGCNIISPKSIIPYLAKLFSHADKSVRAETTKLTVELYKWLGDGIISLLFNDLKPVQQRDLRAEFDKVKDLKPVQTRLTRAQKESAALRADDSKPAASDMDVVEESDQRQELDPFDLVDPIDVLTKIPSTFSQKLSSPKWQERKEALEELNNILKTAPKMADGDYSDLVRSLTKPLKDANIQVVQLTANSIECLSKGLRSEFRKYQNLVLSLMIDRTKEKKPLVSQALFDAMFSIFQYSSLLDILDDTILGMKHITPQIKISSMKYLQRCLAVTKYPPKASQVDQIMEIGVKLLSDSQEPIRQASTELIGTLMKISGERELKKRLTSIDENRLAKVKEVYDKVEVAVTKSNESSSNPASSSIPKNSTPSDFSFKPRNGSKNLEPAPLMKAIPTKRMATSPARREKSLTKAPTNGFTSRTLTQSKIAFEPPSKPASGTVSPGLQEEFELIKNENALLQSRCEQLFDYKQSKENELAALKADNALLKSKVEQLESELSDRNTASRQKDITIARLTSDYDNAQIKIKSLEQKVEMAKLLQSPLTQSLLPPIASDSSRFSPFRSPERLSKSRTTLHELSSRVDRLSIEGILPESNNLGDTNKEKKDYNFSGEEDSWRRAAEVTAELKARIEKMKQRNKMSIRP